MSDLDDAARDRAEQVREKRHERTDPDDRIGRVRGQEAPDGPIELPEAPAGGLLEELPEDLEEEAETTRKKLTYGLQEELGVELDADEQYWPLVVHLGVERLKGMWLEEVRRTLENTEDLPSPDEE